ncbi:hypothetical protein D9757_009150 [Collybiopsis confluens]|uniref:F-box domain-containing protein n=1 Tax=Collybiopsis confluens TaxID=2823264 RepID=A0A8H5H7U2_9AGAR|nr:hypothetical protein D9757_009150 [Collybiopsis confluens]
MPSASAPLSRSRKSNASKPKSGSAIAQASTGKSIRRALPAIDINLNSYNRTDPFQAFNVLIKLIGSLSSRVGGCQYRLTAQEHRLSLHLLSIVEPFVSSTPSKRTLITRQPTEILDAIVFHISSRVDLLNLAMSCSRMHDIVIPRHFDYRVVKCKVSSISVWNHLSIHRSLALNVRRLEVLDERALGSASGAHAAEMVPGGISSTETDLEDTDDELGIHEKQERYLINALSKMTHLESFVWSCNHSPISIDLLWPMLLKCHTLKEVEFSDNMVFSPAVHDGSEGQKSKPAVAKELKTVALKSTKHVYGAVNHPDFTRVKGMLNSCPNLESLSIAYVQPRSQPHAHLLADDLFLFGRWPNLTSLTLTNLRCSPFTGIDAASSFIFAHLNLEVLHLDMSPGAAAAAWYNKLIFPNNCLPHLRELKAHRDLVSSVLACPSDIPRPLETLKGIRLTQPAYPQKNADAFFVNLRRFGTNVMRVELTSWSEMDDIRRLVEAAPKLTWLDLGQKGNGHERMGLSGPITCSSAKSQLSVVNVTEWAMLLSAAPELTTFHGVKFFYEVSHSAQASIANAVNLSSFAHGSAGTLSSSNATSNAGSANLNLTNLSMTDRSRIRKNDETAGVLAWKCTKLRRVDHWEDGTGKVIVIARDGGDGKDKDKLGPRWEIRRVKQ